MPQLNDDNFLIFAMQHYDKVSIVSIEEFENDLIRFRYLKKLFNRYETNGDLKERLILNHLIVLYNVFGNYTTDMLFYKIPQPQWGILSTFLIYLNRLPKEIQEINSKITNVELDVKLIEILEKL